MRDGVRDGVRDWVIACVRANRLEELPTSFPSASSLSHADNYGDPRGREHDLPLVGNISRFLARELSLLDVPGKTRKLHTKRA